MQVKVNVYDLTQQSDNPMFGAYHTGVEIGGVEFSFAQGQGIYEQTPREAAGAVYRRTVDVGETSLSMTEVRKQIYALAEEKKFIGSNYNLIKQNCNHFSEAVCQKLLRKGLPSNINRLARWGRYVYCLLPSALTGAGGPGSTETQAAENAAAAPSFNAFAGQGRKMGEVKEEKKGLLSGWGKQESTNQPATYDADEVRKARLRAMGAE